MSQTSPKVQIETTKGTIKVELNQEKAPITVENFLAYVNSGFFDGKDGKGETIFHRVIPNFMIQCGGMNADMRQKSSNAPIKNESTNGLTNDKYTLAMARTSDPDSASSQFFINTADNDFLNYQGPGNPGYAVFGKVIDGSDVVDAISAVKTASAGYHDDVPTEPIKITKAEVITE